MYFIHFSFLTAPVNGASLLYMCNDDAMRRTLGATPSCDLYAKALLTLHHVHFPDVVGISGLQKMHEKQTTYHTVRYKCYYILDILAVMCKNMNYVENMGKNKLATNIVHDIQE